MAYGMAKGLGVSADRLRLRPMSDLLLPLAQAAANRLNVRPESPSRFFNRISTARGMVKRLRVSAGRGHRLRPRPTLQQLPSVRTPAQGPEIRKERLLLDFRFRRKRKPKG